MPPQFEGSESLDARSMWSALTADLESGGLSVDRDVARKLVSACRQLRDELVAMKDGLDDLAAVKGMGTLQSGIDLAKKFSEKAVGGEDSLEKTLDSHIAVVKEMRAYFQACIDRYESMDDDNANRMARHEVSGS
ncbi:MULTISPECIES: hypothetical protein [unclassified Rhodococcus (in: high G+C Gram-positive bacteria)]|uniref:hypothetical protein n=1 Tax=unclassified Rhodococcus (in: high G+C Gram-positive bacteria) TaxID=192944 RepID=UPI0005E1A4FC|nr:MULTISPECIES: hypothetical protein [unclassified Rhodococcus (in: high G+C Gram-positive bacteria)]KJF19540.1 hypothetical protein SZ00_05963 [Rhodococcus sp. AD45]